MNFLKSVYCSSLLVALVVSSALAQTGGTVTKPASTTSTNRQQELYDQYHSVSKKPTNTTSPVSAPATPSAQPQRQTSDYGSTQAATVSGQPRRTPAYGGPSSVRVGVRGGATYVFYLDEQSQLSGKSVADFVGGVTFNIGAGAVSFQPEINYARYSANVNAFGTSYRGAVDLIEVPLLLKIASGSYLSNRFFVNVGPYGSYLASASVNGQKESLQNRNGRFGYGAALGVGAALKAGPGHVTVEARGLYALGDTDNGFDADSKVIRSQLTLGYSFPLGGR